MPWILIVEQLLNGLQLGVLLFLLAAGLTLIFGIMDFFNLAHGTFYMLGAFVGAALIHWSGSFVVGVVLAIPVVFVLSAVVELAVVRPLYRRHHLDHVLATFGMILFCNALVQVVWPVDGLTVPFPAILSGTVSLPFGIDYSAFRLMIIVVGVVIAIGLWYLVNRTRLGMLIRAGASEPAMVGALGVNIKLLFTLVFALGAALAGFAGALITPILGANSGMGEQIIIRTFVVIVIGGIGSIRGAFVAALIIGLVDTLGRSFLDQLLLVLLPVNAAEAAGPAMSSMLVYLFMVIVLVVRPQGLFAPRG